MDFNYFLCNFDIRNKITEYDDKYNFLQNQLIKNKKFICVCFKEQISFFDLSTIKEEYKIFYHIPYNLYFDLQESHIAFQTKLEINKLLNILEFYEIEIDEIEIKEVNEFLNNHSEKIHSKNIYENQKVAI